MLVHPPHQAVGRHLLLPVEGTEMRVHVDVLVFPCRLWGRHCRGTGGQEGRHESAARGRGWRHWGVPVSTSCLRRGGVSPLQRGHSFPPGKGAVFPCGKGGSLFPPLLRGGRGGR